MSAMSHLLASPFIREYVDFRSACRRAWPALVGREHLLEPARPGRKAKTSSSEGVAMFLYAFVPASRANGPGLRAVVYFQGCSLQCAGCWNPDTHKFRGAEATAIEAAQRFEKASRLERLQG